MSKENGSEEDKIIKTAMSKLLVENQSYSESGVPLRELMRGVLSSKLAANHSKKFLEGSVERAIESGRVVILDNGNARPKLGRRKGGKTPDMTIRVGERRKRAKKVFDPSDNEVPKKKRGRPVGSLNKMTIRKQLMQTPSDHASSNEEETNDSGVAAADANVGDVVLARQGGVCSVCRQYAGATDPNEKLISCRDCSNKAHPYCLRGDGMLRLRPDNTWQCPFCKTCVVCVETNDAGILTVCSICSDAYHQLCHSPNIPEKAKAWELWECNTCQKAKSSSQNVNYIEKPPGSDRSSKLSDMSDSTNNGSLDRRKPNEDNGVVCASSKPPKKRKSTALKNGGDRKARKKNIFMEDHNLAEYRTSLTFKNPHQDDEAAVDGSIPDVLTWSYMDVFDYFRIYFPEHAHVFKEQCIDGQALLNMRRVDVINYLGIELGSALMIYYHVVKLQSRRDDLRAVFF